MRQDGSARAIGRVAKRALLLLVAVSPVAGLTACGSGSTSASTTASSVASAPAATSTATSTTTRTATAAQPPAKAPHEASPSASGGSSSGDGGGGASFREPHADNSIPDFGAEASTGELARATGALAVFLHARASGEWSRACTYLAGTTRAQLERFGGASKGGSKGCGTALAALSGGGHGASPSRAETLTGSVAALRVKGNSAFALYRGPNGNKYVMPMVKEGGAWKIGQLAPIAYPIGTTGAAP